MGLAARCAVACRLSDDPAGIGRHLRAPGDCQDYARLLPMVLAAVQHDDIAACLDLMERCDALRKPDRFMELIAAASLLAKVDFASWRAPLARLRPVDAGAIDKQAKNT